MDDDAEPDPPDELELWVRRLLAVCDPAALLRCLADLPPDPRWTAGEPETARLRAVTRGGLVKVRTIRRVLTLPGGRLVALEFPAIRRVRRRGRA